MPRITKQEQIEFERLKKGEEYRDELIRKTRQEAGEKRYEEEYGKLLDFAKLGETFKYAGKEVMVSVINKGRYYGESYNEEPSMTVVYFSNGGRETIQFYVEDLETLKRHNKGA